jgi:hypothetical protein
MKYTGGQLELLADGKLRVLATTHLKQWFVLL